MVSATNLTVRLTNAPSDGTLIFQVYDSADTFGDLRDPVQEVSLPATGNGNYLLADVSVGNIALLVYYDENSNGRIDKNFIGIPRERIALSNNYQPKGPPRFVSASFDSGVAGKSIIDMDMYQLLGNRGRFGVGVGVIGRSSPYSGSSQSVTQVIPGITYVGERLQWFGPALRYGIAGSGKLRLAAAAEYRIGAYEESDSPVLAGLGDRDGTLTAGLGLQYEISKGFELEIGYQHDVLGKVGGGLANARLSRGLPVGKVTFVPQIGINWLSSEMSDYNFGVPIGAANVSRPAYTLGSTSSYEFGLGAFIELSEDWQFIVNVSAERLDSDVSASPIVDDDTLVKGFAMISYIF
jgi:outer membrane protein